jgi:hypothetical protein
MFSTSVTPLPNLQSCRLMIRLLKNNNTNKGEKKVWGGGGGPFSTLCKQNSKVTFIGHSFRYWVVSAVFFSVVVGSTDLVIFPSLRKPKCCFVFSSLLCGRTHFYICVRVHTYTHAVFLRSLALVGAFAVPSIGLTQPGICLRQWTDGRD